MSKWTKEEIDFLIENYADIGKMSCATALNKTEGQVRSKASQLGLKQNKNGEFFKEWQERAAQSKIGKKNPKQSEVMKKKALAGEWINPSKTASARKKISDSTKQRLKENGHPKGALGMKHTNETKQKLSESTRKMWENMPEHIKDEYAKRASINGHKASPFNRKGATWKSGWREFGGTKKYYRSKWEANYARYLQWLLENKQILKWEHEPETFWFEGIKRGVMSYLPDFRVTENDGTVVYHEVKGWMDDRSKTKIKRMAKYHPNVKLIVIDSKAYKAIEKKAKILIKDWE